MPISRRTTLRLLLGGSTAVVAAPVVYVAGRFLSPGAEPLVRLEVAPLAGIDAPRVLKVGSMDAIVMRSGPDDVRAFSLRCTHAACNVNWKSSDRKFFCPCHGGVFDEDGAVLEGPPEEPLHRLQTEVRNGIVLVSNIVIDPGA